MAIKDVGKFKCHHKMPHKNIKVLTCLWCKEKFERPSCWSKKVNFALLGVLEDILK